MRAGEGEGHVEGGRKDVMVCGCRCGELRRSRESLYELSTSCLQVSYAKPGTHIQYAAISAVGGATRARS
eukprot:905369-Rhodomonas_salina.2